MSSNVDRTAPLGSSSEAGSRPSDLIAELIAARLGCEVAALSDDTEPLKLGLDSLGMLSVINQARRDLIQGMSTVLFIDEVHRFSKTQQDALLAAVENRVVLLVAATPGNPSFSVAGPPL